MKELLEKRSTTKGIGVVKGAGLVVAEGENVILLGPPGGREDPHSDRSGTGGDQGWLLGLLHFHPTVGGTVEERRAAGKVGPDPEEVC